MEGQGCAGIHVLILTHNSVTSNDPAGRHMYAGMRTAKLEIKLILAMFFASFAYEVVDSAGGDAEIASSCGLQ
ncbi:hypothetical protein B0H10DRAFT_2208858 [Mycena sp. CBHHK59/15]|nr:hypothetical protein B0H10DRAFT_2208858 [Mycena sp. CBHHK59/15]